MTTATDLVAKKNDGTTNVTYSLVVASGGDRNPAIFRDNALSAIPKNRSKFTIEARSNAAGTARRVTTEFSYPYIVSVSGGETVSDVIPVTVSAAIPGGVPDSVVAEAIAQWSSLHGLPLVKDSFKSGFAPT